MRTEVLIVGGGLGGVAAALAAVEGGVSVVLVEGDRWLGGQLTAQAIPSDEHRWSEQFGITASYRRLRDSIRRYYRDNYPLTAAARSRQWLNPGGGFVSPLCHEPRVGVAVIEAMLAPWRASGRLTLLQPYRLLSAEADGDFVHAVTLVSESAGDQVVIEAAYVLDATETGELLPAAGVEYVTGFESTEETGEPSAPDEAQPANLQGVSWCFAMDHVDGDHTISRPAMYDYWRAARPANWTGPLLSLTAPDPRSGKPAAGWLDINPDGDPHDVAMALDREPGGLDLWRFRRIAARNNFEPGFYASDITLVNWPRSTTSKASRSPTNHWVSARMRRRATGRPPDNCPCQPCTGCRQRSLVPTAAPAIRACDCVPTSLALPTASPKTCTSGNRGASKPSAPSPRTTCRWQSGEIAAPHRSPIPSASTCTASTSIPRPAAIRTSMSRPRPSRFRSPRSCHSVSATSCPPPRTSAPPTSPMAATVSIRLSGTSVRPPERWQRCPCGRGSPPHQVGNGPTLIADFQGLLTARGIELSYPMVGGY